MKRVRHLVAYDIRDPKRLRLVHRKLQGFGMPFQYSVFLCDLTSAERFRLLAALADIVDSSVDCVATVELGDPKDQSAFTFVGPRPDIRPSRSTVL